MSFPSLPKDVNQIPISSIYIPGTGFVALQGTNSSTDGSGNPSAGVVAALYGKVTNPGDTPLLLDSSGRVLIGNITQSDTFGNATNITAATTFSGVPTISQLAANSSVLLANPGAQATFIAEVNVASAFVGTLSFYGLEPDGTTLQLIGTHLRGIGTTAMSIAISTAVALNQTWMGSAANFKSVYVVCTAFTSGSVSVQLGLSAAPYAQVILNTVAVTDIETANYTAATSPPATTNAGSDTSYTFSSQISRVIIQNNTSANVYYAFDVAASLGSLVLVPGSMLVYPKKVTVLHLFTAAAQNINGTAVGGIVVLGAN